MPTSLRLNGPKKLDVNDGGHRSKRVKTVNSPTDDVVVPIETTHTPVNAESVANGSDVPTKYSRPIKSASALRHARQPSNTQTVDLKSIPGDPVEQAKWIAETTQALAVKKMDRTGETTQYANRFGRKPDIPGLFVFDVTGQGDTPRTKQRWAKGSSRRGESLKGSISKQQIWREGNSKLPPLQLDPGLLDKLFAPRKGDSGDSVKRNACGKLLLQSLLTGSQYLQPDLASHLKSAFCNSQDDTPYIAAFQILANDSEVLEAINNAMRGDVNGYANRGDIASVPTGTEVPSLITDGDTSGITSQDETPEVVDESSTRRGNNAPSRKLFEDEGPFPRLSITPDAVQVNQAFFHPSNIYWRVATVNALKNASAVLDEMAQGRPLYYVTPYAHGSTNSHPSFVPNGLHSTAAPLPSSYNDIQYATPYANPPSYEQPLHHSSSLGDLPHHPNLASYQQPSHHTQFHANRSGKSPDEKLGKIARRISFTSHGKTVDGEAGPQSNLRLTEKDQESAKTAGDDDDNWSLTEAQLDGFLAMANGGELKPRDDDATEEDLDRERTISRATTPEQINTADGSIEAIFEGIIAELGTNHDHGHGIAFLSPQVAYYQSVNGERFATELRRCITEAKPSINVLMSAEQCHATSELYKRLESRINRPPGYLMYPQIFNPYDTMPNPHYPTVFPPQMVHQLQPQFPPPQPGIAIQQSHFIGTPLDPRRSVGAFAIPLQPGPSSGGRRRKTG